MDGHGRTRTDTDGVDGDDRNPGPGARWCRHCRAQVPLWCWSWVTSERCIGWCPSCHSVGTPVDVRPAPREGGGPVSGVRDRGSGVEKPRRGKAGTAGTAESTRKGWMDMSGHGRQWSTDEGVNAFAPGEEVWYLRMTEGSVCLFGPVEVVSRVDDGSVAYGIRDCAAGDLMRRLLPLERVAGLPIVVDPRCLYRSLEVAVCKMLEGPRGFAEGGAG